ncbi:N-acetylmuramoyl-L-alanine amidase [Veillonella montpellierensis]|uniref:peptidoglycan recognition protein family protein n=1 Tax=Veillonella montpellierensis TaxID=187328 RepID=UPI0006918D98|nr:N-acetylmuramoyl-L-alanine amidase [Veillonella montpellierensis]
MNYTLNDIEYLASVSNADKVTLHWSATDYDTTSPHYHICILGDGTIYSDHDNFDVRLAHTSMRNTGNIGVSIMCMQDGTVMKDGTVGFGTYPPTDEQIETMAQVVASICKGKGWQPTYDVVKTHSEWADIDGYGIFDDDPDLRWDLYKIPQESGNGGDIIRGKANWYLSKA